MSKRAFISYSHDSEAHKDWVLNLASTLRQNGVDVVLDQWDVNFGDDLPGFMEKEITESDRIIVVCTDQYIRKANEGIGGVGYEKTIVTAEMLGTKENRRKIIPIVRNVSDDQKVPTFVGAMYFADLSDGKDEEAIVSDLIRQIHEIPKSKPPLGSSPFVPEQPPEQMRKDRPRGRSKLGEATIIEFSRRFSHAFPGLRGIEWLEDADAIGKRLEILLRQPLVYEEGHVAWWWRGTSNMHILSFERVEGSYFLMDGYELNISRIAAVNMSDSYFRKWLYVEASASAPTGLYPDRDNRDTIKNFGYDWEEFGLVDGTLPITRAEYDDGAALIEGNPVNIIGRAELRSRYTTAYNFLLAPNQSPINNHGFDRQSKRLLNAMLRGEDVFGELCESIEQLPPRHH